MTAHKTIRIGTREVGPGQPVFIIAEAGVNHNGDMELARKLIDTAAKAGADAVKFQTFTPEELASETAEQAEYQIINTGTVEAQLAMLKRLALPRSEHQGLKEYAQQKGLIFLSTPFSIPDSDFLETLDIVAYKIPSGEITNTPFLAHVAKKGKPILLSTGMSTLEEVREAIEILRAHGARDLALFHCTSQYPAPAKDMNLRAMVTLEKEFGLPTGLSDHSEGIGAAAAAVALGACLIEKHFTLDRSLPGPDHKASLETQELSLMVEEIRRVEVALGSPEKKPSAGELATARIARKSVVARRSIDAGVTIVPEDVHIVRPGTGIPPRHIEEVVGRKTKAGVSKGTPLTWDMLA